MVVILKRQRAIPSPVPGQAAARRCRGLSAAVLLSMVILSLATTMGMDPRTDPETGKIRLLFLGWVVYPTDVTWHYKLDPLLDLTGVPLARRMIELGYIMAEQAGRFARIYMPRTYTEFHRSFDVVFLEAMDVDLITPAWNRWFRDATVEEGLGLAMTGGWASFGGNPSQDYAGWGPTWVGGILPVDCLVGELSSSVSVVLDPTDKDEPLISSLPWARAVCFMSSWLPSWGVEFVRWEYCADFASYLVYYTAGLELPSSPELVHRIRERFSTYRELKDGLLHLADFIERYGVSSMDLVERASLEDPLFHEATALYIAQEYDASLDKISEAITATRALENLAFKLKNRALLWVYAIEWMSVTAASMLSGAILWTLMVRKKAYRSVPTTRTFSR
jgi:hypothetical protein